MKLDYKNSSVLAGEKPVFSWFPILVHFVMANLLAWLAISIPNYNETFQPFVDLVSSVIPSVAGMGELSPNPPWGEIYVLFCLAGSPIYMRFTWKVGAYAFPQLAKDSSPFKFWLNVIGMIFFPWVHCIF
jgi:hypothetical protein